MPISVRPRHLTGGTLALLLAAAAGASAQQAVIVVRHAEKADQSTDPPLAAAGRRRAQALAELLRGSGVTHVVTTEYRRTRDTAAPLAAASGVTPEQIPARDLPALTARLRALGPAAVVLVVGHSNTVPSILSVLGWPNQLEIPDRDYDDVFVLVPHPGQGASVVRLAYGRPTP